MEVERGLIIPVMVLQFYKGEGVSRITYLKIELTVMCLFHYDGLEEGFGINPEGRGSQVG